MNKHLNELKENPVKHVNEFHGHTNKQQHEIKKKIQCSKEEFNNNTEIMRKKKTNKLN
jgi:hypothetical protein